MPLSKDKNTKKKTRVVLKSKKLHVKTKNNKTIKGSNKSIQFGGDPYFGGNAYNIECRMDTFDYGNKKNQRYVKGIRNVRDCEYVEDKLIKHLYGKNFVGIPIIEKVINDIRLEKYKNLPNKTKYPYEKLTRHERLKHLVFQSIEHNSDIPDDIKQRVTDRFYSGFIGLFRRIARSNKDSELYEKNNNSNDNNNANNSNTISENKNSKKDKSKPVSDKIAVKNDKSKM
jgi:hypothetical protein